MNPDRHTTFYEVWDALGTPGDCGLCALHGRRAHQFVANLFYENVNHPGLRAHWHESLGFGDEGRTIAAAEQDALGLSILYASLAHDLVQRLNHPPPKLHPARPGPLETVMRKTDARYLDEFVRHYGAADVQARHAAGFGLCLAHLDAVLRLLPDPALRMRLCEAERTLIARLQSELQLFADKSSYDSGQPFGPEADAWQRALRKFRRPESP
jgi:hypothetical protein